MSGVVEMLECRFDATIFLIISNGVIGVRFDIEDWGFRGDR